MVTIYPGRRLRREKNQVRYVKDIDILLIELSDKPIDYAEDKGQVIIHFSSDGELVLIEICNAKEFALNVLFSVVKETEVDI